MMVMLRRRAIVKSPRVEVAVNDDPDDDGSVGYDFKEGGWRR